MSTGFTSSTTKGIKSFEHEVETRMASGELVGTTQARWGRIDIYKVEGLYNLVVVKTTNPKITKRIEGHSNIQSAIRNAHAIAQQKDLKLAKCLDIFTDDFQYHSDAFDEVPVGADTRKDANTYQDKHDDYEPRADQSFKMAAAGKASDQPELDQIDQGEQAMESGIKKWNDQFPGSTSNEIKRDLSNPEEFNREVDKRMKRLAEGVDETKWSEAKKATHKIYPDLSEDNDKFWKIVQTIYGKMGGK